MPGVNKIVYTKHGGHHSSPTNHKGEVQTKACKQLRSEALSHLLLNILTGINRAEVCAFTAV